ncbi:MAG TPA: sigma-70 family RNA polymerase sigma factor [Acidimicrobiales bacterium]|nr:sigma-70 family RNA polymerase sigma factor [Acidimicrobiales bacterium]
MAGTAARNEDFEAVYAEIFPRAATLAYRLLGNRTAAEDVAAEALARAYARWHKIAKLPHRDGWILRVATNLAIDATRRRIPAVTVQEPLDATEAAIVRLALVNALRSLPRRQRQAVALRYLSGFRETEVAETLGISAGTASAHLRRGLDGLRLRLGNDFREDVFVGEPNQA